MEPKDGNCVMIVYIAQMHAGYQFKRSRLDQTQQNSTRANQNIGQLDTTTTAAIGSHVCWRLVVPCMMYKKAPAVVNYNASSSSTSTYCKS